MTAAAIVGEQRGPPAAALLARHLHASVGAEDARRAVRGLRGVVVPDAARAVSLKPPPVSERPTYGHVGDAFQRVLVATVAI
jgi:hypothetical protein